VKIWFGSLYVRMVQGWHLIIPPPYILYLKHELPSPDSGVSLAAVFNLFSFILPLTDCGPGIEKNIYIYSDVLIFFFSQTFNRYVDFITSVHTIVVIGCRCATGREPSNQIHQDCSATTRRSRRGPRSVPTYCTLVLARSRSATTHGYHRRL
jgi:hypothetical protein